MGKSRIEWCEHTWNPLRVKGGLWGCTKVSPGCLNCYASRLNHRFGGREYDYTFGDWKFELSEKILFEPERRQRPTIYFVCSVCDLFHEAVTKSHFHAIWHRMANSPQHLFLVLTKRPARMRECLGRFDRVLENVWLGVSAENQEMADERIPLLLDTPAAKRFVSCEPLLGAVSLFDYSEGVLQGPAVIKSGGRTTSTPDEPSEGYDDSYPGIDWVIVGGESGPGARPMSPFAARSLRDQCEQARVPFFFKQWGEWFPMSLTKQGFVPGRGQLITPVDIDLADGRRYESFSVRLGKKAAGRLLDGKEYGERPEWGNL